MEQSKVFSLHTAEQPAMNIAMFIDADNAPKGHIGEVLDELCNHGMVSIRRAFGNWKKQALDSWVPVLHQHAIQPVQVFDLIKGKNASDIAMVCDAMDVLYNKPVDVFCLVSSDSDFTPLVMKLRSEGKQVIGVGERKAASPFVDACTFFIYLDDIAADSYDTQVMIDNLEKAVAPKPAPEPPLLTASASVRPKGKSQSVDMKNDSTLITWIREAINQFKKPDGTASVTTIAAWLKKERSLLPGNYGYTKLSDLLKVIDLFELQLDKDNHYRVSVKERLSAPPSLKAAS
ncbi:NYN domain-containing protein [Pseudomonas fluorescens]|nr:MULTISPECIES: NYN domain-containing protein [Pseudomonas]MBD8088720.1 NYN domain-containing protein [Pseudomonas fluorescens]MBD8614819.1 NYN domain-containing protein [Pseudomonas putida]MBD8681497.1 NYN domain-containing protein [Pseudomonas sp. CFBP 13719]